MTGTPSHDRLSRMMNRQSAPGPRWALVFAGVTALALVVVLGALLTGGSARPRLSGYLAGRDAFSTGGGAHAMTVYTPPTVVVPPPPATPAPAAPAVPAASGGGDAQVLDNPNNT